MESTASESNKKAAATLNEKVAESIAASNPTVVSNVIAALAEVEIKRRTKAVIDALVTLNQFRKEQYKIKPDIVSYNADGSPKDQAWSKAKLEEKKKLEEKIAKYEKAIDLALGDNQDYTKLFEVAGNDKSANQSES